MTLGSISRLTNGLLVLYMKCHSSSELSLPIFTHFVHFHLTTYRDCFGVSMIVQKCIKKLTQ
jgi:hypothetical protein